MLRPQRRIVALMFCLFFFIFFSNTFLIKENQNELSEINDLKQKDIEFLTGPKSHQSNIFDGLYINHSLDYTLLGFGSSAIKYSYISGNLFSVTWDWLDNSGSWKVNNNTRIITDASTSFNDNTHTPFWIFTNVSLHDTVPISIRSVGDKNFNVSGEMFCNLTGYGMVEAWILEELGGLGSIACYEKSTGLLLNGTFHYVSLLTFTYSFNFSDSNAPFFYYVPAPNLTLGSVNPVSGNQTTLFAYTVNYSDVDNNEPEYVNVLINGTPYSMWKQNPSDDNYTDGCIYEFETHLNWNGYPYNYSFECFDGYYYNNTRTFFGPTVSYFNDNPPTLGNGDVNLTEGEAGITVFNFTVNYTDSDNNFPNVNLTIDGVNYTMNQVDQLDTNYTDGCIYQYLTTLDGIMTHEFNFTAYDGDYYAFNGTFNNPKTNDTIGPFISNVNSIPITGSNGTIFNFTAEIWDHSGVYMVNGCIQNPDETNLEVIPFWDDGNHNDGGFGDGIYGASWNSTGFASGWYVLDINTTDASIYQHQSEYENYTFRIINWSCEAGLEYFWNITKYLFFDPLKEGSQYIYDITDIDDTNFPISTLRAYMSFFNASDETTDYLRENYILESYNLTSQLYEVLDSNYFYFPFLTVPFDLEKVNESFVDFKEESGLNLTYSKIYESNNTLRCDFGDLFFTYTYIFQWTNSGILNYYHYSYFVFTLQLDYLGSNINYAPELISDQVNSTSGDQNTEFNFTTTYFDLNNRTPAFVEVTINGTSYDMDKVNPSDNNYIDGCEYIFSTYLVPNDFNYTYYYSCSDGIYANWTITKNDLNVSLTNDFAPYLLYPDVTPTIGLNSTLFNFTIWYYDQDNNFPVVINATLNNSITFVMEQVFPLDNNAMDGVQYYFNSTLDYGSYSFQINCSDGLFSNGTNWIIGPEVNPFYGLPSLDCIIINEICSNPDFIEMYNFGPDKDMTGWYINVYDDNGIDIVYNFPNGWIFYHNYIVVLHENSGSDTDTDLYTGINIMWANRPIAAGLFDDTGKNIDWVQTSTHTLPLPPDAEWVQDTSWTMNNNYAYRTSDIDGNLASDWTVASSGSQGSLNPGQTGDGGVCFITLLTPVNTIMFFSGWVNFTWLNLEAPFGAVNYTLQISNKSDFSIINIEVNNINETPSVSNKSIYVSLSTDLYYWRVCPTYGPFKGNWSDYFTFNLTYNENAPKLESGKVLPINGDQWTQFDFTIIYFDSDNNYPYFINVTINGTSYTMEKSNPSDNNYTDGCLYQYLTYLSPNDFNYTYYFNCSDGKYTNWTIASSNLNVSETNIFIPFLLYPEVSPIIGLNSTLFNFTIWYYDDDNNFPLIVNITLNNSQTFIMLRVNPLDDNATDGIKYYFNTTLDFGYYQFQINCSDGLFANGTNWIIGPEVNPFYGVGSITLLNPSNSSALFTGWTNFTWSSLELTHGSVNYTLHISNTSDFYEILNESIYINETPSVSNKSIYVNLPTGLYYWRVRPTYGLFKGNWTDYFLVNLTMNQLEPELKNGSVEPTIGHQLSVFNFTVSFFDQENNYPVYINVTINGTSYAMTAVNPSDTNFTDGCLYQYLTYLTPNDFNYTYYFNCSDGKYFNWTTSFYDLEVYKANDYKPFLNYSQVSPYFGLNSTLFKFTVWYFDQDNNFPLIVNITFNNSVTYTMLPVDPLDDNATDGILYYYNTTLDFGYYEFQMNCSDGLFANATDWIIGPEVNPFFGLSTGAIKVVILQSAATDPSRIGLWQEINSNWITYGSYNITIDYITLNIAGITYNDLVNSGADVIVVADAYGGSYDFTMAEINAIYQYVQEGRGLVGSGVTFWSSTNNFELAPIFGMYNNMTISIPQDPNTLDIDPLGYDYSSTVLFDNLTTPMEGYDGYALNGWQLNASDPGEIAAVYVGAPIGDLSSVFNGAGVIIHEGGSADLGRTIFATHLSTYNFGGTWTWEETQLYYNILVYAALKNKIPSSNVQLVSPNNSSDLWNELINFTWTSLNADIGAVNYTLQISNTSDFTYLNYELKNIIEEAKETTQLVDLTFTTDQYYWRVRPTFEIFNGNWSDIFTFNLIINNLSPNLTSGQVLPNYGFQTTTFNFTVIYTDLDNNTPTSINAVINGTVFPMIQQNPLDSDYTDGCLYYYTTLLIPALNNYTYFFNCSDGKYTNWTTISSNLNVTIANIYSPWLLYPNVNPATGSNSTLFNFTVFYYDRDNDLPSSINITINGTSTFTMLPVNPLDNNATDGIQYYFNSTLNYGSYQFQINCSDGFFKNGTIWIIGPHIDPFNYTQAGYTILFQDDFEDGSFNSDWTVSGSGTGEITTQTSNSGIYSANHHGGAGQVTSRIIDLSSQLEVNISYWVQRGDNSFSERPDTGEDLIVEYYNDVGSWIPLDTFLGSGTAAQEYNIFHILPADALHANFRIRFRQTGASGSSLDYWHFDDVILQGSQYEYYISSIDLLLPVNGSSFFTGWHNFTWTSLEGPFGAVNYTLQISNKTDFTNINIEVKEIIETPTISNKSIYVDVPTGQYYWRVCPTYGPFKGNWSEYYYIYFIRNEFEPSLINGSVEPRIGHQFSVFNYTVLYLDKDNNTPIDLVVFINGTSYAMEKVNPSDNNYVDGCLYQYLTYLIPNDNNYTYYFNCTDGKYTNWTITYNDLEVYEANNYNPYLLNPQVSPNIGLNSTIFTFTAWYYDDDNNFPLIVNLTLNNSQTYVMTRIDPFDSNATDGIQYFVDITIDFGYYQFQINCSDGLYKNATNWIIGPVVNPFYGAGNFDLLSPSNSTNIFTGLFNFIWESLELASGSVKYSIQISSQSDFSEIYFQLESISELPTNTSVNINVNFPTGTYYWRVCPTYGPFKGNWADYFILNVIANFFEPNLINISVIPKVGDYRMEFNFTVVYRDLDNNVPAYVILWINNVSYSMKKVNLNDINYVDGCVYYYSMFLSPELENLTYYFKCSDGKYTNITVEFKDLIVQDRSILFLEEMNRTLMSIMLISVVGIVGIIVFLTEIKVKFIKGKNDKVKENKIERKIPKSKE